MFYMPIVVLFYHENGLDEQYIFYLHAVYSICIVIFEIPSGYIADILGRKPAIIMGTVLGFAGFAAYAASHKLIFFIVAEVLLGIGQSCISGSDSAILYDSLYELKQKNKYLKTEGRITGIGNYAEAFAGLLGPIIAVNTFRTTYIAQACVAFVAIPAALMLAEPHRHKPSSTKRISQLIRIVKFALIENKELRSNILFSAITGACTLTMAWYAQIIFDEINVPNIWFGALWAVLNVLVGVGSYMSYKVVNKMGMVKTAYTIAVIIPLMFIICGLVLNYYIFIGLTVFYILRGIATPMLKNAINLVSSSDIRATVLSVRSLIIRLIYSVLGPAIGIINKQFSLAHALVLSGLLFMILTVVMVIPFIKSYHKPT